MVEAHSGRELFIEQLKAARAAKMPFEQVLVFVKDYVE